MRKKKTTKSKGLRCLVTGGAGFIGSRLVDRLVALGHRVTVVDDLSNGRREYLNPKARFHRLSIGNPKLAAVFSREKPEVVFHLAAHIDARVSVADPIHDAEINIHGSLRVLEAALKNGAKRLIFSSSGGAIHHEAKRVPTPESEAPAPLTPYGVAKLAFEHYLHAAWKQSGLEYVALRYANVYGPRQDQKGEGGVIGVFCKQLLEGRTPKIHGDGRQTRDFVYVDDVVDANILAMTKGTGRVLNVATGRETDVNEVAALIAGAFGVPPRFPHGKAVHRDVRRSALDPSLARRVLGWKPKVRVEDGIRRTVEWFLSR